MCTLDTGAPGPVCLGAHAAKRLRACTATGTSITQHGVNDERICSNVVTADVSFFGIRVPSAAILLNDTPVDHTDGYLGLGFLRAFDLLLTTSSIGVRASGLEVRRPAQYPTSASPCDASKPPACAV